MQKKELQEIRTRDLSKLKKEVEAKKLEVYKFNAEVKVSQEKNLKKGKNLRRDLSQILTIIRERQLAGEVEVKEESAKTKKDKTMKKTKKEVEKK